MYYYGEGDSDYEIDYIIEEEIPLKPFFQTSKKNLNELIHDITKPVCLFGVVPVTVFSIFGFSFF